MLPIPEHSRGTWQQSAAGASGHERDNDRQVNRKIAPS